MLEFWSRCLSDFEKSIPAPQFNAWIRSLRAQPDQTIPHSLRLIAPNRYVMDWVRKRYLAHIQDALVKFTGSQGQVILEVDENSSSISPKAFECSTESTALSESIVPKNRIVPEAPQKVSQRSDFDRTRLRPDFTFDMLVSGRSNEMARASAQHIALDPGTSYNPLFIYGGTGLGKTHLIHAIGNAVWSAQPTSRVLYIHAAEYVSDFIKALQQKSFDSFKNQYHNLDLLLIDDIQFFNGKERTQEEFFYTFNVLIGLNKQIVITCDTYAKDLQGIDDRLVSRFSSGLMVQIQPPDLEMRVAILKKKAESENIVLNDDVAFLIAKNLRSNVRDLEGALKRVSAYSSFQQRPLDLEMARDALRDIIGAHNRQITLELIQKTVSDYYKIKLNDLFSPKRTRAIARPRQVSMWLCRELTSHSLPEIGDAFGGRDHTTVIHACRQITDLRIRNDCLNNDLNVLIQTIKG
jgi:chromosomal replication initiator protein